MVVVFNIFSSQQTLFLVTLQGLFLVWVVRFCDLGTVIGDRININMERNYEVNRLERQELVYELKVRGAVITDETTVKDMRKSLRSYLELEKSGSEVKYPKYPFTFKQDIEYIAGKIAEIEGLISDFADFDSSPQYLKILSKLVHTFARANRITSDKDEELARKSQVMVELLGLQSLLKSKARKFKRASQLVGSPVELSALMSSTTMSSESASESDSEVPEAVPASASNASNTRPMFSFQGKSVPVAKWNITKFDGTSSRISLSAFLENVEELRRSRHVSFDDLFSSANDLFSGKALLWFRSIRSKLGGWDDLVRELRLQFLPIDFNDKLLQEIKRRTQGEDESMGIYIAIMTNMFNRLTVPVSDAVRLRILMQNINPFYQSQLGLVKVDSIEHLLQLGRQLESRKESIQSFVPPPRNRNNLMEPDLAYVYSLDQNNDQSAYSGQVDEIAVCWNCKVPGHKARTCTVEPRSKYCFKCGHPGVTVRTCPTCTQRSGNSRRSR